MGELPEGWIETTLGEVCTKIGDGLHGTPKYTIDGNYFFVNGNNLLDGKIVLKTDTKKVNKEQYDKYKKDLGTNTILVSINGTIGNLAKYNNEKCILGKSAGYLNIKDDTNLGFIYYLMLDKKFQYNISRNANGSTIKNVSLAQLREYSINLPPLQEQKAIANILSSFDEKIELLKEQNETLEQMAQSVFKESFTKYKNTNQTTLGKLVKIKYGKDHKHLEEGKYPLYGSGGIMRHVETALYTKESILIPRKGTLSNLFFIQEPFWSVDTIFYTEIDETVVSPIYLFYKLKRINLANLNVGSAVPSLTTNVLNALEVEVPSREEQEETVQLLTSFNEKKLHTITQIQTLQKTRDTLLPKLMSGKTRVNGFGD